MSIKIYEAEKSIASLIENNNSVAYTSDIQVKDFDFSIKDILSASANCNINQPDLFYIESLLVSTNWNKNDDVFIPEEVWAARKSPEDKMFNYMHDEKDIIGHITSSYILTDDKRIIHNDSNEMPNCNFNIIVGSVIYKSWSDIKLRERMEKIIAEIVENKWFVSMEALFNDFSYALLKDDKYTIINRNEATAFLTKHLRAYGGNGVYNDYKVGRILKNIVFSGKGLVDNPANEKSDILSHSYTGTLAFLKEIARSKKMDQEEFDKLKAELDALKSQNEKSKAEKIKNYEETIAKLQEELKVSASEKSELETKLSNVEALSTAKSEKIEKMEAEMKEKDEEMNKMKKEKEEAQKAKCKADRIASLVSANVDPAKAAEVVETFATADDSMFSQVVELYKSQSKENKQETNENADASKLENLEQESSASLNSNEDESKEHEDLAKSVASWLGINTKNKNGE